MAIKEPYFQSTPFTCAASSLLTILHHFNPEISLTKEKEFEIWRDTANLPTRGSSIYALANYAKKKGLKPQVIVEEKKYSFPDYRFYRYTKKDIEHASLNEEYHLKESYNKNLEVLEKKISFEEIKKNIKKDKIILLRINTKQIRKEKRNTSNYIIVHGYSNKMFQIIDPAFAALSLPEATLEEAFNSLPEKKFRDNRLIIF